MSVLTKKEKIQFVLDKVKEYDISAYELGKKTGLNISGVERIINGSVKNPHEKTLDVLVNFLNTLYNKNNISHVLHEEKEEYLLRDNQKELIDCLNEQVRLMREISRLQIILEKNNIEY